MKKQVKLIKLKKENKKLKREIIKLKKENKQLIKLGRKIRKKKFPRPSKLPEYPIIIRNERRQIANTYRTDKPPYAVTIRVITLNPEYSELALRMALNGAVTKAKRDFKDNLKSFSKTSRGLERLPISKEEYKKQIRRFGNNIYVEVMIKDKFLNTYKTK